jgi:hypothetical protein
LGKDQPIEKIKLTSEKERSGKDDEVYMWNKRRVEEAIHEDEEPKEGAGLCHPR